MSSRRRLGAALVALGMAGSMLAACGSDDSTDSADSADSTDSADEGNTSTTAGSSGDPQPGGSLTFLDDVGPPATLDPGGVIFSGVGGSYHLAVFDSLVYEQAGTGEIAFQLAESLDSEDAVNWTLTLRDDVTFSDGTPFDAEAVEYNWLRLADPDNATPSASAAQSITSIEVVAPLSLEVELKEPNAQFPRVVAQNLTFIGSPTALEELGNGFGTNPVGAGPFLLESIIEGNEARYTRNPDYWNAPLPYLDELVLKSVADDDQRYSSLITGEGDLMQIGAGYQLLTRAEDDNITVREIPASGGFGIPLNTTLAPFDDPLARQALGAAIDRDGLLESVLEAGLLPFESLFGDESPFYLDDVAWPTYDPDEAQRLLDEYADTTGGPLTFTFLFAQGFESYGEFLLTQLATFDNLDVDIEFLASAAFQERVLERTHQATLTVASFSDPEPVLYLHYISDGTRNRAAYSTPEMDEALTIGRQSLDPDERIEAYETVQRLAAEDLPIIWFAEYRAFQLHTDRVQGLEWAAAGANLWDRVWLQ